MGKGVVNGDQFAQIVCLTLSILRVRISCRAIRQFECEQERFLLSVEFRHNELAEFHCTGRNVTIGDPPYA